MAYWIIITAMVLIVIGWAFLTIITMNDESDNEW